MMKHAALANSAFILNFTEITPLISFAAFTLQSIHQWQLLKLGERFQKVSQVQGEQGLHISL